VTRVRESPKCPTASSPSKNHFVTKRHNVHRRLGRRARTGHTFAGVDDATKVRVLSWVIYLALVALVMAAFYSPLTLCIVGLLAAAGVLFAHRETKQHPHTHL
jgi:Flp pilus assembly protein TadB